MRQAGAEIEITPEMIEAGVPAFNSQPCVVTKSNVRLEVGDEVFVDIYGQRKFAIVVGVMEASSSTDSLARRQKS